MKTLAFKCLLQDGKWTIEDRIARSEEAQQKAIEWWTESADLHNEEAVEVITSMFDHLMGAVDVTLSLIGG